MLQKLAAVKAHYEEVANQLTDPAVIADNARYRALTKEYKQLTPIVETYEACAAAQKDMEEAKALLDAGGMEADFRQMVQEEFEDAREKNARLTDELRILLLQEPQQLLRQDHRLRCAPQQ